MSSNTYTAGFLHGLSDGFLAEPDVCNAAEIQCHRPSDGFVMSRRKTGEPLSFYGDDVWDFRSYRLAGDAGSARMHFSAMSHDVRNEAKWLMFLLIYVADSMRGAGLVITSLMGLMKPVRHLSSYCDANDCTIKNILEDEILFSEFVSTLHARGQLRSISALVSQLIAIDPKVSGYNVLGGLKYSLINKRLSKLGSDEQHPVIPPRIYLELISRVSSLVDELFINIERLTSFISEVLSNNKFARCRQIQRQLGCRQGNFEPGFIEASDVYGLSGLFAKYGVDSLPALSSFLTRAQHACRVLIFIYSGMRNSEGLSLKLNSLREIKGETGISYRLIGETSKLIGQKKIVSWVTSVEIVRAFKFASMLAKFSGEKIGLAHEETPLFISTSYLGIYSKHKYDSTSITVADTSVKSQEVFEILDNSAFIILEEDLNHLEEVNPFRAWEAEEAFSVGSIWRFTTHQYRRSLAFYVSQSAHVSLPSLKRQLKHISREMTIYYCQSKQLDSDFNDSEHISQYMKKEKPLADATAYIHGILMSDEHLFGAHGKFVETNLKSSNQKLLFKTGRDEIIKQFKRGEISYKETPLGACTTIEPCDQKATRAIAACLSCDRSVIKESKLSKVIERQEAFVSQLRKETPDGVEYRSELAELDALKDFKIKIVGRRSGNVGDQ